MVLSQYVLLRVDEVRHHHVGHLVHQHVQDHRLEERKSYVFIYAHANTFVPSYTVAIANANS